MPLKFKSGSSLKFKPPTQPEESPLFGRNDVTRREEIQSQIDSQAPSLLDEESAKRGKEIVKALGLTDEAGEAERAKIQSSERARLHSRREADRIGDLPREKPSLSDAASRVYKPFDAVFDWTGQVGRAATTPGYDFSGAFKRVEGQKGTDWWHEQLDKDRDQTIARRANPQSPMDFDTSIGELRDVAGKAFGTPIGMGIGGIRAALDSVLGPSVKQKATVKQRGLGGDVEEVEGEKLRPYTWSDFGRGVEKTQEATGRAITGAVIDPTNLIPPAVIAKGAKGVRAVADLAAENIAPLQRLITKHADVGDVKNFSQAGEKMQITEDLYRQNRAYREKLKASPTVLREGETVDQFANTYAKQKLEEDLNKAFNIPSKEELQAPALQKLDRFKKASSKFQDKQGSKIERAKYDKQIATQDARSAAKDLRAQGQEEAKNLRADAQGEVEQQLGTNLVGETEINPALVTPSGEAHAKQIIQDAIAKRIERQMVGAGGQARLKLQAELDKLRGQNRDPFNDPNYAEPPPLRDDLQAQLEASLSKVEKKGKVTPANLAYQKKEALDDARERAQVLKQEASETSAKARADAQGKLETAEAKRLEADEQIGALKFKKSAYKQNQKEGEQILKEKVAQSTENAPQLPGYPQRAIKAMDKKPGRMKYAGGLQDVSRSINLGWRPGYYLNNAGGDYRNVITAGHNPFNTQMPEGLNQASLDELFTSQVPISHAERIGLNTEESPGWIQKLTGVNEKLQEKFPALGYLPIGPKFGQKTERATKEAFFKDLLNKGHDPNSAGREVTRATIDYGNALGPYNEFLQNAKALFPYIGYWGRAPLETTRSVLQNPRIAAQGHGALEGANSSNSGPETQLPGRRQTQDEHLILDREGDLFGILDMLARSFPGTESGLTGDVALRAHEPTTESFSSIAEAIRQPSSMLGLVNEPAQLYAQSALGENQFGSPMSAKDLAYAQAFDLVPQIGKIPLEEGIYRTTSGPNPSPYPLQPGRDPITTDPAMNRFLELFGLSGQLSLIPPSAPLTERKYDPRQKQLDEKIGRQRAREKYSR